MKRFTIISLLSLLFTFNALAVEPPRGIRHYDIGLAPNFKLADIDGEPFELKDERGNWVFLHFWASWCGPCIKEMPIIDNLTKVLKDPKLKIIMVNTAEDEDTIFTFLGSIGVDATSLMDSDGTITEKYKPRGLPTTFLIDPQGRLKYQAIGGREWTHPTYLNFLKKLLKS